MPTHAPTSLRSDCSLTFRSLPLGGIPLGSGPQLLVKAFKRVEDQLFDPVQVLLPHSFQPGRKDGLA